MKRIKIFTHNDLDGYGCVVVGAVIFGKEYLDVSHCVYENINERVTKFIKSGEYKNYSAVFITDISVNEEVAELIDIATNTVHEKGISCTTSFLLLDHHKSALPLNKYNWCNVVIEDEHGLTCGTYLLFKKLDAMIRDMLPSRVLGKGHQLFQEFVEMVRRYDTWEWKTKYNDELPNDLNILFKVYGEELFTLRMIDKINAIECSDFIIEAEDEVMIKIEKDKMREYIGKKNKSLYKTFGNIIDKTYKFGVVFAENHLSTLGNELCALHPDLDFVVIINAMHTVSLRSIKEDVDLSEIAKYIGQGGGHRKAAGFKVGDFLREEVINTMFNLD